MVRKIVDALRYILYFSPKCLRVAAEIKIHLPKELKEKFVAKAKKSSKTQTAVLRSLIHNYLKEKD